MTRLLAKQLRGNNIHDTCHDYNADSQTMNKTRKSALFCAINKDSYEHPPKALVCSRVPSATCTHRGIHLCLLRSQIRGCASACPVSIRLRSVL